MKLFTAPDPSDSSERPRIFLAGSIEQGTAKEWQQMVIDRLSNLPVTIYNPRRNNWDASMKQDISNPVFAEQVNWELDRLDQSDVVFFYFQGNTLSPITLTELGIVCTWVSMHADAPYVIVVCEPDFWRIGNVQVLCERAEIRLLPTLDRGLDHLVEVCARYTCGH